MKKRLAKLKRELTLIEKERHYFWEASQRSGFRGKHNGIDDLAHLRYWDEKRSNILREIEFVKQEMAKKKKKASQGKCSNCGKKLPRRISKIAKKLGAGKNLCRECTSKQEIRRSHDV